MKRKYEIRNESFGMIVKTLQLFSIDDILLISNEIHFNSMNQSSFEVYACSKNSIMRMLCYYKSYAEC